MSILKTIKKAMGKVMQPHTWEDAAGQYNIGDEKTFSDGSTRILNYAPSGVRRWLGIHDEKSKDVKIGPEQSVKTTSETMLIEEPPQEITKKEWMGFNKYLNEQNPFLNCVTYDELVSVWFAKGYEYQNRLDQIESSREIYGDDIEDEIGNMMKKIKLLDNQCLAYQMYKVSYLIDKITELEPTFNYNKFINKNNWQELIDYLEKIKEPQEIDYSELYEGDENVAQQNFK